MLNGSQAYELGLADAIFDSADFLARSLDWAGQIVAGSLAVTRRDVDRSAWDQALVDAREFVDSKVSGAAPAPYRAIELMSAAKTAERTEAFEAEDDALADLIMSHKTP